ncbi:hypothetical protein C8R43DRAFT_1006274 [Mycena crocata]|nr:hypothetical protein C8R43DRAFT_1006274 [Mycena crocata]
MPAPNIHNLASRQQPMVGNQGVDTVLSIAVVSTLFYGMFLVVLATALYLRVLLPNGRTSYSTIARSPLLPVLVGTVILFVTITTHWALLLVTLYSALNQTAIPAFFFYQNSQTPAALARHLFLFLSWIIGDLLIIYRLWTVWAHNKLVIIFPVLTWIGLCVSGAGLNVVISRHDSNPLHLVPLIDGWFTSELVFTICTTLYCTAMFAFRIWSSGRHLGAAGATTGLMTILGNVVQSAALYTAWIILTFVVYKLGLTANFWAFESSPGVVGVTNMLIYVRVGLERKDTITNASGGTGSMRIRFERGTLGTGTMGDGFDGEGAGRDDMQFKVMSRTAH